MEILLRIDYTQIANCLQTLIARKMCIIGPDEPTLPHAGSEYLPPGLTIINDFITAEEEELLLATLDWTDAESGQCFSCYLYSLECWWQFSIYYGNMEM